MKVESYHLTPAMQFQLPKSKFGDEADLVVYFASKEALESCNVYHVLQRSYPRANIIGCSTGGEITLDDACDESVVVSAISFEHTKIKAASVNFGTLNSFQAGEALAQKFDAKDMRALFVLSDGLNVNGSDIIRGIQSVIGEHLPITGGLAGDGDRFEKTLVGLDQSPQERNIAAVAFYGDHFHLGYGAYAGGEPFGPFRTITKSDGNVVYEIDNEPALDLYKSYLGKVADDLPASALYFPMIIAPPHNQEDTIVRAVLSVDENTNSLTFAGDMPQGHTTRLMLARKDQFLNGAEKAASLVAWERAPKDDMLAILVSCIGRKLVMNDYVVDEVDIVRNHFDRDQTGRYSQIGFFSYGEICPHRNSKKSALHNETMTISLMYETHPQSPQSM